MYMPLPAMSQAMTAPRGPVACAKVLGSEKMPAPIIPPTTMAVSAIRDIFLSACAIDGAPGKGTPTYSPAPPRIPLGRATSNASRY